MYKRFRKLFLSNPLNLLFLFIAVALVVLTIIIIFNKKSKNDIPITEGQIQIVKANEIITINQNGLIEYRTKDRVYTETWDASQIESFFSMMKTKAQNYLSNKTSGGDCGYKVFMFLNGKFVTICIDSGDQDMSETIEPIIVKYSDVDISDYFDDTSDDTEEDDEFDGVVNFPTSTPGITRTPPTPTPYTVYNIDSSFAPVTADCDSWSADIVGSRAIISNTFCTVGSTPTPIP